jgi:hypothetical protein
MNGRKSRRHPPNRWPRFCAHNPGQVGEGSSDDEMLKLRSIHECFYSTTIVIHV